MKQLSTPGDTDHNQTEAGAGRLVLEIQGMGPIPSFKTGKRGTWGKTVTGKVYSKPVTKKEHGRWMKRAILAMQSQLISAIPVMPVPTQMEQPQHSWTASQELAGAFVAEFDDKWKFVRRLSVNSDPCEKGDEGATIVIECL